MVDEKEERRKKKLKEEKKVEIFAFDSLESEEKLWDSGLYLILE